MVASSLRSGMDMVDVASEEDLSLITGDNSSDEPSVVCGEGWMAYCSELSMIQGEALPVLEKRVRQAHEQLQAQRLMVEEKDEEDFMDDDSSQQTYTIIQPLPQIYKRPPRTASHLSLPISPTVDTTLTDRTSSSEPITTSQRARKVTGEDSGNNMLESEWGYFVDVKDQDPFSKSKPIKKQYRFFLKKEIVAATA